MAPDDDPIELATNFATIARALLSAETVALALERTVHLAVATIDGCDHAGISLLEGATVTTPIATDEIVARVDGIQYQVGEGPCLAAIWEHETVEVEDLASDQRWPVFAPLAVEAGMGAMLSYRLFVDDDTLGALNLFATRTGAFTAESREIGLIYAAHAAMAVASAKAHADEKEQTESLRQALASRDLIGQAKGILMSRDLLTADQAFDVLRRASQRLNEKLRDVAQLVVDTGQAPPPPPEPPPPPRPPV